MGALTERCDVAIELSAAVASTGSGNRCSLGPKATKPNNDADDSRSTLDAVHAFIV